MHISKIPKIIRYLFSSAYWKLNPKQKTVYLTFDDGPTHEVTEWVMDQLSKYQAKGSFFCLGNQVEKHPDLYQKLIDQGHLIGNHTYDHPSGWSVANDDYYHNIKKATQWIDSSFFRPPYGKIKLSQFHYLKTKYQIVMWDVVSFDYVVTMTGQECAERVLTNAENGSIIVFHDSKKAWPRLKIALPTVLEELHNRGYHFDILPKLLKKDE